MKKTYIFFISTIILLFSLFALLLQDSQSKFTLKVKSSIPKETRFFLKRAINQYFYNFDINLKFIKKNEIISSNGVKFNIVEYNNKLLDYQGPRAYLGIKDKNIFLVTGTGLMGHSKIDSLIEAEVTKSFMGSPVNKKITLRVKYLFDTYCLADEEKSLDYKVPMRKIKYEKIKLIDGMLPVELAAVYGLAPKTERFKKRIEQ